MKKLPAVFVAVLICLSVSGNIEAAQQKVKLKVPGIT